MYRKRGFFLIGSMIVQMSFPYVLVVELADTGLFVYQMSGNWCMPPHQICTPQVHKGFPIFFGHGSLE